MMRPRAGLSIAGPVRHAASLAPGVAICGAVGIAAFAVQFAELHWFHHAWIEAVALSIVVGLIVRIAGGYRPCFAGGVAFCGKVVLEAAIVLLGASVSLQLLGAEGPWLLAGVGAAVLVSLAGSYLLGRLLGLSRNQATLVACGNSICGNSAIAAVAPVIGADGDDVAASIAFTAVLSIVVVVGLPYLAPLLSLSPIAYGVLAGLTVYAVPQVVAATAPIGAVAMQAGALVKLTRVLMLAPAIAGVAALGRAYPNRSEGFAVAATRGRGVQAIPWFVIGFLAMLALRSTGLLPSPVVHGAAALSGALTTLAMAALGLMVDVRVVAKAGLRVSAAATVSIFLIGGIACVLLRLLGMA